MERARETVPLRTLLTRRKQRSVLSQLPSQEGFDPQAWSLNQRSIRRKALIGVASSFYIFMTYPVSFSHLILKLQREVTSDDPTLVVFTWRIEMVSVFPAWTLLP